MTTGPTSVGANATTDRYARTRVDVGGEDFLVGTWAGTGTPVFAMHGISSNHLLWSWAADAAPTVDIIAPDLRGRGASTTAGPFGVDQHVADMFALLDELGLDRVVLAGMSMGAYIATRMAAAQPERFTSVLLVDGGLPMRLTPAAAEGLQTALAARGAATTTFPNVDTYVTNYLAAFDESLGPNDPLMPAFLGHNLVGDEPNLMSGLPAQAMSDDTADLILDEPAEAALASLTMPVHLIHAEATKSQTEAARWADELPEFTEQFEPGTDHATIIMGKAGGTTVAEALTRLLEASRT